MLRPSLLKQIQRFFATRYRMYVHAYLACNFEAREYIACNKSTLRIYHSLSDMLPAGPMDYQV